MYTTKSTFKLWPDSQVEITFCVFTWHLHQKKQKNMLRDAGHPNVGSTGLQGLHRFLSSSRYQGQSGDHLSDVIASNKHQKNIGGWCIGMVEYDISYLYIEQIYTSSLKYQLWKKNMHMCIYIYINAWHIITLWSILWPDSTRNCCQVQHLQHLQEVGFISPTKTLILGQHQQ